jgi:hypothetical protein
MGLVKRNHAHILILQSWLINRATIGLVITIITISTFFIKWNSNTRIGIKYPFLDSAKKKGLIWQNKNSA